VLLPLHLPEDSRESANAACATIGMFLFANRKNQVKDINEDKNI
jgi:hypothetical protein